jgi:hypothetical protein
MPHKKYIGQPLSNDLKKKLIKKCKEYDSEQFSKSLNKEYFFPKGKRTYYYRNETCKINKKEVENIENNNKLKILHLDNCDIVCSNKIKLPDSLEEFSCNNFDKKILNLIFPSSLKKLSCIRCLNYGHTIASVLKSKVLLENLIELDITNTRINNFNYKFKKLKKLSCSIYFSYDKEKLTKTNFPQTLEELSVIFGDFDFNIKDFNKQFILENLINLNTNVIEFFNTEKMSLLKKLCIEDNKYQDYNINKTTVISFCEELFLNKNRYFNCKNLKSLYIEDKCTKTMLLSNLPCILTKVVYSDEVRKYGTCEKTFDFNYLPSSITTLCIEHKVIKNKLKSKVIPNSLKFLFFENCNGPSLKIPKKHKFKFIEKYSSRDNQVYFEQQTIENNLRFIKN